MSDELAEMTCGCIVLAIAGFIFGIGIWAAFALLG